MMKPNQPKPESSWRKVKTTGQDALDKIKAGLKQKKAMK